ncbi:MAG: hypothetical protein RIT24_1134 [Planctomycetota bacterium]|jgi:hypothetical protein
MRIARSFGAVITSLVLSSAVLGTATVVALATVAPTAGAASIAPPKELDFTASELRLFKDPETGKHFWYMTYDVVNNTGKEVRFAPRIDLVVDDGRILAQGEGVSSGAVRQLKKYLKNELLEDQFEILGEVLPGKEHAKTGLVVFRADDLEPTELTVMVQGLSRETEKRAHPKTGEPVTLRKTVRIDYLVSGDPKPRGSTTYPIVNREWIFR